MNALHELIPHFIPFQFFFAGVFVMLVMVMWRAPDTLPNTIAAFNSIGSSPMAIVVLVIGCMMLIECKAYGLDPTIAGGIIGVASNMLTSMIPKAGSVVISDKNQVKPTEDASKPDSEVKP